ncbi:MAG: hypothetical protein JW932_00625 [Deltaproteobacteria bacterium]|nr:hypothetical protein [Deltaproteobacteria bacterium]
MPISLSSNPLQPKEEDEWINNKQMDLRLLRADETFGTCMVNQIKTLIIIFFFLASPVTLYGQKKYNDCDDSIVKEISIDKDLYSEFFDTSEASYPWYIIRNDDGTFESILDKEITQEDITPIEHTSNCVSTHQGEHIMHFCDAVLKESDHLELIIHGGLPAYASSLMIQIDQLEFKCFFMAVYPSPVFNLKWKILSKELKIKTKDFKKGDKLYGWLSVEFDETGTYQGKSTKEKYKIEGYLKPTIKN